MCDFLQLIQQASDEYKHRNSQCQKYKLINWSICKTKMNFWWIFTAIFFGMQLVIFSMCFAKKRIFFVIILTIGFKLWLSSLSAIMEIQFCDFIVFIYNVKIFKRKPFRIDFWNCQVHKMKQHTKLVVTNYFAAMCHIEFCLICACSNKVCKPVEQCCLFEWWQLNVFV